MQLNNIILFLFLEIMVVLDVPNLIKCHNILHFCTARQ